MFLRSCASALRNCAKGVYRQRPRRTLHTRGSLCCEKREVDWSKSVNLIFNEPDGTIRKEKAFVNERFYDFLKRIDERDGKEVFDDFGSVCCGALTCGTCHIIMEDEKDFRKLEPAEKDELDLLPHVIGACATSRLGCGLFVTEQMEGMVITIPRPEDAQLIVESSSQQA